MKELFKNIKMFFKELFSDDYCKYSPRYKSYKDMFSYKNDYDYKKRDADAIKSDWNTVIRF